MKFANYKFQSRGTTNIGDQMQIIAIDYIYQCMGVKPEDIVYIDYHHLKEYDGEYVVVPVTMPMVDYFPNGFAGRFSERIVPVFLGLTMVKEKLSYIEVSYLKKFEPIGCRDERTFRTIRKHGIVGYLHGCITMALPRRTSTHTERSIYIVDVGDSCMRIIPEKIREKAIYRTHFRQNYAGDAKTLALQQYQEYIDNASLVITSLLHCSVPCAAAGIPVIMLTSKVSYRKAWLEKLLPIYSENDAKQINWNPGVPEWEDHKKLVKELTIKRLQDACERYSGIYDLSYYYETREKKQYINDACESLLEFIANHWLDKGGPYKYAIWGLSQVAECVVDYISENYNNAILCHVYDTFRHEEFRGITSEPPSVDKFRSFASETVFVTTNGAEIPARAMFKEAGLGEAHQAFLQVIK